MQRPFKSAANAGTVPKLQPLWLPHPLQPQLAAKNIKKGDRQQHFVVPTEQTSVVEGTAEEEQMKEGRGAAGAESGIERGRERERGGAALPARFDYVGNTSGPRAPQFPPHSLIPSLSVSLSLAIGTLPAVNLAYEAGSAPAAAAAVATAHFAMRSKGSFVLHVYKYAYINRNIFTFF